MATIQQLVDAVALLDTSVQANTTQSTVTKAAADALVLLFQATKDSVDNDLNNVTNTADADKIISDLVQTALGLKQANLVSGTNISTVNGQSLLSGAPIVIADSPTSFTSLSYANKGTLRTPLDENDLPLIDHTVTVKELGQFMFVTTTDEPDDDETCFTAVHPTTGVPIGQWLLEQPAHEWLDAHHSMERSQLREWMDDEYLRFQAHHI